jgi:glucokinase
MILAGDISSTTSVLGLFKKGNNRGPELVTEGKYPSKDYPSMEAMVQEFLQKNHPEEKVYAACFGISGPVEGGRGKIVGLSWEVTERRLCESLMKLSWGVGEPSKYQDSQTRLPVEVINSLGAIDFNSLETREKLVDLNPNASSHHTEEECVPNCAWIAASAGLGEASLYWDRLDREFRIFPSEGGHANFAPRNQEECDLLLYLLKRYSFVSYNRVLSENGLVNLYEFFRDSGKYGKESADLKNRLGKEKPMDVIIEMGLARKDTLCEKTIDLFVSIYGAEAGNLALKYAAWGGVYVGGTIAPKIIDKLCDGTFMKAFTEKEEVMKETLSAYIPVKVVMTPDIRLRGTAQRALDKELIGRFVYSNVEGAG